MNCLYTKLLLLFLGYFFQLSPIYAFGKSAHKIICQASFQHLTKNKQDRIAQLLLALPAEHKRIINRYNHKKTAISFADSCTWADAIKSHRYYQKYKSWHYINTERDQEEIPRQVTHSNNIVAAINFHKKMVISAKAPWEKLQALMFLSHWVGDIHQPLHVSYASDLGGNKTTITDKSCGNLHRFWDNCLLVKSTDKKHTRDPQQITTNIAKNWSTVKAATINKNNVVQWANESLSIIRQKNFNYCQQDNKRRCNKLAQQPIVLPYHYIETHQPILDYRLLLASLRLHAILHDSF